LSTAGYETPALPSDQLDGAYRKIVRRLVPLLFLCYLMNFIDRACCSRS